MQRQVLEKELVEGEDRLQVLGGAIGRDHAARSDGLQVRFQVLAELHLDDPLDALAAGLLQDDRGHVFFSVVDAMVGTGMLRVGGFFRS